VIVIPTIPLRAGACVLLERGDSGRERIRLSDPLRTARHWDQAGFRRLHIVDLDGAMGTGSNDRVIEDLLAASRVETQVGGGVRTEDRIERLLGSGAARVVIGTRALEDTDWLEETANRLPNEIIVAADVRDRRLVTRGWLHALPADIIDTVEDLTVLPLAGLIVTAVDRQGTLGGTDLRLMEDIVEASTIPVYAAGGISSLDELRSLADRGVSGAVVGMALYSGAIDAGAAAWEFGE
jgi:phosphoribosylformimino-5-aminoimidazole carboxamide ribotide isomerase